MTARILRIELRRSAAPWIALLIVVFGAALIYLSASRSGWWMMHAVQQRSMLALLWSLALGAGAWQALRERRSRMEELVSTTPRPRWRRVLPTAAAMAIAGVAGYLGMFAAGTGQVVPVATYFPIGTVPIVAVGALSMIAAVWLGLAIGSRLPSILTPPILGAVSAAALLAAFGTITSGADVSGTFLYLPILQVTNPFSAEFVTVTAQAHLSQALWLVALAATGLAAFAAASRRAQLVAIVPAVLGVAITLPLLPRQLSAAFALDQNAIAQVCTPDTPRVCVTKAHEGALTDLRGPARQALTILSAKLPTPPTTVAEEFIDALGPNPPSRADTVLVAFRMTGGHISDPPETLLWNMLSGAGTGSCVDYERMDDTRFDRDTIARLVAAAWLIDQAPPAGLESPSPTADPALALRALDTLRGLPADEQRARVVALREAELACDDRDRLDILIGPSGPR